MSENLSSVRKICPHCGALTRPRTVYCWLCGATIESDWLTLAPGQIPPALSVPGPGGSKRGRAGPSPRRFQFGISTLLLIMTLFAVLCSVWRMAPGLGAVLTVAVLIGLAGLFERSLTAAKLGVPFTREDKVKAFFRPIWIVSIGIVAIGLVIGIVAFVGFWIMCSGQRF